MLQCLTLKRIPQVFCIFSYIVYIFEPILSLDGNSYKSAKYQWIGRYGSWKCYINIRWLYIRAVEIRLKVRFRRARQVELLLISFDIELLYGSFHFCVQMDFIVKTYNWVCSRLLRIWFKWNKNEIFFFLYMFSYIWNYSNEAEVISVLAEKQISKQTMKCSLWGIMKIQMCILLTVVTLLVFILGKVYISLLRDKEWKNRWSK